MPDNVNLIVKIFESVFNYSVNIIVLNKDQDGWLNYDGIFQMPQMLYTNNREIFVLVSNNIPGEGNNIHLAHYYPIFPITI